MSQVRNETLGKAGDSIQVAGGDSRGSMAGVQVSGTWAGTIVFEASINGVDWISCNGLPIGDTTPVSSTTTSGIWQFDLSGGLHLRLTMSLYASGAAVVHVQPAQF